MYGSPTWTFWLIGFGLTVLLEAPLVAWLLAAHEPSLRRRLELLLLANLLTHPLVWFFFPSLPLPRLGSLLLSEAWAFGLELYVYARLVPHPSWQRAATTSLLANATSWGLGSGLVRHFGSWLFG